MKPTFSFSIALLIAGFLVTMFSCKRENVDYIGPGYVSAPEGFAVTSFSASSPTVDFSSGSIDFDATFTHTVTWILTITGQESGAVKEIRGTSNNMNNVVWTGAMDGALFFKKEIASATLSFFGTSLTQSVDVTITEVPDYSTCGIAPAQGGTFDIPSGTAPNTGWNGFNLKSNGDTNVFNVRQGVAAEGQTNPNNTLRYDRNGNLVKAPQGNGYYYISGVGDQNVFVSGVGYGSYMSPGYYKNRLPSDPSQIWVNVYLYGSGDPNAGVELEFQESANGIVDPNPLTDDYFVAYVTLTHTGWKLFSFKYSSLTPSLNKPNGGSGNKIHEPQKLWGFDAVLVKKTDPTQPIELFMDYPIITIGAPFKPCK